MLGVVNFHTFVYIGLQSTTATNAVIMLSITPVLIVALSFLLLGPPHTAGRHWGFGCRWLGVLTIVARGDVQALLMAGSMPAICGFWRRWPSWALYSVCLRWRPAGPAADFQADDHHLGHGPLLTPLRRLGSSSRPFFAINGATVASIGIWRYFPSIFSLYLLESGSSRIGR